VPPRTRPHEEDVSAQQYKAKAPPRIPGTDGHEGRSAGPAGPTGEGAKASERLSAPVSPSDRQGFGRSLRLTHQREFDRVFRKPELSTDRIFKVLFKPNGLDYPRLGLAIARKRIRRASARNRVKRMVRESFRLHQADLVGYDVVVLAQAALSTEVDGPALRASLAWHWLNVKAGKARYSGSFSDS
jgi:ribonuclease P protein component